MNKNFVKFLSCFLPKKQWRIDFRKNFSNEELINYYEKHIYAGEDIQDLILNELNTDKPSMICRFGGTEMRIVDYYLKNMNKNSVRFPKKLQNMIGALSGFFPSDNNYLLSRFSSEFLSLTNNIDILAVWSTKSEKDVCKNYLTKSAKLMRLKFIQLDTEKQWTSYLKGKKVLVIHPFAETIEQQYKKRELLFENKNILPEFELITFKPVQGLADSRFDLPYDNWFDALNDMEEKISKIDFDIALIGAGAYGIFLADFCKKLGKKAIHVGGDLQLLFGIKGKRWDIECPEFAQKIYNEHWVRPSENEKPKGCEKVEGGCYW